MSNVARLDEYRSRDTMEALKALVEGVEQGKITGLVIGWKTIGGRYGNAATGAYADDPIAALGAASKLWGYINSITN